MTADLTDDEREKARVAIDSGLWSADPESAILDALLALGWSPRRTGAAETAAPTPDAIAAAEARGRREGIEAALRIEECAAILDHPSVYMGGASRRAKRVAAEFSAVVRALSPTPPQEEPK